MCIPKEEHAAYVAVSLMVGEESGMVELLVTSMIPAACAFWLVALSLMSKLQSSLPRPAGRRLVVMGEP